MKNIELQGAKNIRDLGGIKNKDGKVISKCKFIRGSSLDKLTDRDIEVLTEAYNLHTVIDLRTTEEIKGKEDVKIPNVNYIHIPIFNEQVIGISHEENINLGNAQIPNLKNLYKYMVCDDNCVAQFKKVFDILLNEKNCSILYHCTEGKDRTGIVTMILLYILDVPFDIIFEDYLYTNIVNGSRAEKYAQMILEKTQNQSIADKLKDVFLADKSYLQSAIDGIQGKYGSFDSFVETQLGISAERKIAFQMSIFES
jgi:protein-tyrosine phosphatase